MEFKRTTDHIVLKTLGCDDNLKNDVADGRKFFKFSSKIWCYLWFLFEEGVEIFFKDFKTGVSY